MTMIEKKYQKLALTDEYLTDSLLMTLAWKKSHHYVRTTNWYADNFELDLSALSLSTTVKKWCEDIKSRDLLFKELELVPAPKQYKWSFHKNKPDTATGDECLYWHPNKEELEEYGQQSCIEPKEVKLQLRPLAHIPVREQSMMTLLMMCLANDVETAQGDPATKFDRVHEKKVVNYGNRLYCRYDEEGNADHSYGATTIYSKYFSDNRLFLERPYYFAEIAKKELSDDQEIFLIELDLSKFFDLVDRVTLCEKIRDFAKKTTSQVDEKNLINQFLSAFENWQWSEQASNEYELLCKSDSVPSAPRGIPQGLVAGGFLANIYLLSFDQAMTNIIGKEISEDKGVQITLIDYCRYVDDMRLTISAPKYSALSDEYKKENIVRSYHNKVKEFIAEYVDVLLKKHTTDAISLNSKKTKLESYKPRLKGISGELNKLQQRLSGPIPFDDSQEYLGQLEALLFMSSEVEGYEQGDRCKPNRLALIEQPHMDVRGDTLKRFATNKIARILKVIRNYTAHAIDKHGHPIPCDWDYQQERLARRLIACWSQDPSLVLLLKKGLELFPCVKILSPILEQLNEKLRDENPKIIAVAEYCLSEIFRHAAITIHRLDPKYIPLHADHETFFEELQREAVQLCQRFESDGEEGFELLAKQARFLLLVRLDSTLEKESCDHNFDFIIKLINGFRDIAIEKVIDVDQLAANILLAKQLTTDVKPLNRAIASLFEKLDLEKCVIVLSKIALQDIIFFKALIRHARPLTYAWVKQTQVKDLIKLHNVDLNPLRTPLDKIDGEQSLLRLIQRADNPFNNELMALKLMRSLLCNAANLAKCGSYEFIDIEATKVKLVGAVYTSPPSFYLFDANLEVKPKFSASSALSTHLHSDQIEIRILQRVAICIRSSLIGNVDWSGFSSSIEPKIGYRGIKSSGDKRAVGMMNTPQSIGGESAQISHWLTTLLSKLLIWPGISVNDQGYIWPTIWSVDSVKKLVDERLAVLKENYCQNTQMLGLVEQVFLDWKECKNNLTVAMVQSKLPRISDFNNYGLMLNNASFRSKHRRHVAEVALLVCKHIDAQRTDDDERNERGKQVDLIILPELAVHHDDMDILISLSRKTHSIIYAGLGYIEQENIEGPNNCAVWIVPPKANSNQKELIRLQGKHNMMADEIGKIKPWRPYQLMLELKHPKFPTKPGFMLTGSICYDATDISLSADLRNKSNAYIVCAFNKDINTFDTMIDALHYHMFQPVVLVNSGVYGGSCAKAPYSEPYHRLIAHSHGNDQVSINTFEMNMFDFRRENIGGAMLSGNKIKTQPAGVKGKGNKK